MLSGLAIGSFIGFLMFMEFAKKRVPWEVDRVDMFNRSAMFVWPILGASLVAGILIIGFRAVEYHYGLDPVWLDATVAVLTLLFLHAPSVMFYRHGRSGGLGRWDAFRSIMYPEAGGWAASFGRELSPSPVSGS